MSAVVRYGCISCIVMFPVLAEAACPDQAAVASYVADFKAARASKGFGTDLTLAEAECARDKLAKELPQVLGRVIGYKAIFTNPAMYERIGVKGPAWGVMFEKRGSSGIRVGHWGPFSATWVNLERRQHGGEDLKPQVLLVA